MKNNEIAIHWASQFPPAIYESVTGNPGYETKVADKGHWVPTSTAEVREITLTKGIAIIWNPESK